VTDEKQVMFGAVPISPAAIPDPYINGLAFESIMPSKPVGTNTLYGAPAGTRARPRNISLAREAVRAFQLMAVEAVVLFLLDC